MKRALALIILIAACITGFLSIRGTMPFMPIFGSSMEPTLHSGNLLMIEPIDPREVEVGDIIVYNVSSLIQDYYNYPPVVAHRVIEVRTYPTLSYRTKGDNTGEDPLTILPGDLRGTVGKQYDYLGLPLLFFQSDQGLIFTIISLVLFALFLYGNDLLNGGKALQRGIFAPAIQENHRSSRILVQKIEANEQKMDATQMALEKFAMAIAEYAEHLASHTSAIKGLAEASHELKRSAAEQNKVLMHLMENMGQRKETAAPAEVAPQAAPTKEEIISKIEDTVDKMREIQYPPGCSFQHRQQPEEDNNGKV